VEVEVRYHQRGGVVEMAPQVVGEIGELRVVDEALPDEPVC